MAVDVKNLIGAINPDVYCDNSFDKSGKKLSAVVKEIVKKEGYLKAAEKVKLKESDYLDIIHTGFTKGAFSLQGFKEPIEQHKVIYDASSQSLEQIYFWILDYVNEEFSGAEKLVDNFISSVGSGHFSEMNQKATVLQKEAQNLFVAANTVLRSVINIIYDLKEFKLRLEQYDELHSDEEKKKEASTLSLKQIWLDSVDIKRQNSSIKAMALGGQAEFITLLDAFMVVKSLDKVDDLDLNDTVKRILKQRIAEFERWIAESEKELKKRFEIEKIYLRSQVNSLRLYARWLKPYLKAAAKLEQRATATADIVTMFNTSVFELTLLARGKYSIEGDIAKGELPKAFSKMKLRNYSPVCVIEFHFRSIPERAERGGYGFRGKVEVIFTSFALNDDELKVLREKVEEDDFGDVYKLIAGATEESLGHLKVDLKEFLDEDSHEEKEEKKEKDVNPFSALFSFRFRKEKTVDLSKGIPKDSSNEKVIRNQAILIGRWKCRRLYNDFKKAHEMPTLPPVMF